LVADLALAQTVHLSFEAAARMDKQDPEGTIKSGLPLVILLLIAVQLLCAVVFFWDFLSEFSGFDTLDWHVFKEALASFALLAGIGFETHYLRNIFRRKASLERSVGLASSALETIIQDHFDLWKLTHSERDIAALLVKGLSIAEIASVRGSAEGTVKAHLNAIYRKANVRSRSDLMSTIMDTLVERPLLPADSSGGTADISGSRGQRSTAS
jgi:DNA-binding CsgD family transcriptional regulator